MRNILENKRLRKNKKGNVMLIIWFFVALFAILFIGFIMVIGSSLLNWIFDEAVPEVSNLGMVGPTNVTLLADVTITPLNNIIQSFTWLTGVLYVLMLIGSFAIVYIARTTPSKWLITFWFMLSIILILGAIFISNIYEDFYDDNDDLGNRLKEHVVLSWMLLHSPKIFTFIVFSTAIIVFSGMQQEEFV